MHVNSYRWSFFGDQRLFNRCTIFTVELFYFTPVEFAVEMLLLKRSIQSAVDVFPEKNVHVYRTCSLKEATDFDLSTKRSKLFQADTQVPQRLKKSFLNVLVR